MKKVILSIGLLSIAGLAQAGHTVTVKNNTGKNASVARFKVELAGKDAEGNPVTRKGSAHIGNIRPGETKGIRLETATKRDRSTIEGDTDAHKAYKQRKLDGSTPLGQDLEGCEIVSIRKIRANLEHTCPGIDGPCGEVSFKGRCQKGHDSGRFNIFKSPKDAVSAYELVIENGKVVVKAL
jgi:hypothetical protein